MYALDHFDLPCDFPVLCFPTAVRSLRSAAAARPGGAHRHDGCELTLVRRGVTRYTVQRRDYELHAGDAILLTGQTPHRWREIETGRAEKTVVLFDPALLRPAQTVLGGRVRNNDEIVALVDRIQAELDTRTPGYRTVVRAALERVVTLLEAESLHPLEPVRRALDMVDERYRTPLSVTDIAGAIGCSAGYLSASFRKGTGSTIKSYLNSKRVGHAVALLSETDLPITEVASRSGFGSVSGLERNVRKCTGRTPRDYRRRGDER